MAKSLLLPVKSLAKDQVQQWKKAYPDGYVRVYPRLFEQIGKTHEKLFWNIIGLLDWEQEEEDDILLPAATKLARYDVAYIQGFDDLLYLKIIIAKSSLHPIIKARCECDYLIELIVLYAICGTITRGKEYFEAEIAKTSWVPRAFFFQPLLTLANFAYELKTGLDDLRYGDERTPGWGK